MSRFLNPVPQFFLDDGSLASSGKMVFFVNKDYSTKKTTYSQSDNTIPNTNPVTLDGSGRMPPCFGEGLYSVKFYAYDPNEPDGLGTLQWTRDDVSISELTGQFSDWSALLTYNTGDIAQASDGNYYRSIVNSNKASDPISSPAKWEQIVFFTIYNSNRTYNANDNVVNAGLLYRCNTNGTTSIAPPAAQWDSLTFNGVVTGNLSVSGNITAVGSVTAASYLGGLNDVGRPRIVKKTSDTQITNSIVKVQDPALIVTALEASTYYMVEAALRWGGGNSTANGITMRFNGTSIAVMHMAYVNNTSATNAAPTEYVALDISGVFSKLPNAVLTDESVVIKGVIKTTSASNLYIEWAQSSANVIPTTVRDGSYLVVTKI